MKCHLFFILIFYSLCINAQRSDIEQIIQSKTLNTAFENNRVVSFGFDANSSFLAKYNPVSLTFSSLMFSYQKWISPQISANCLFSPSCSAYSKELIKHYGFIYGTICTADRLMRCDRISATSIRPIRICEYDGKVHEDVYRYSFFR